jgi:hypothetical protein
VPRSQARQDEFSDLQVESADHVDVVGEALFLAVHRPIADLELLAHEILGRGRHEAPVHPEGPADVVHHHPAQRKLLRLCQVAHRADVSQFDHVVGSLNVQGGLIVEPLKMAAGLR